MNLLAASGVTASLDTLAVLLAGIGGAAGIGLLTYRLGRKHERQSSAPWPAEENVHPS